MTIRTSQRLNASERAAQRRLHAILAAGQEQHRPHRFARLWALLGLR